MRWFWYIYVDGQRLASGSAPYKPWAQREMLRYAWQYASEGIVKAVLRRAPRRKSATGGERDR